MDSLSPLQKPRERTKQAFFLALITAALMFLPYLIIDKGYFIFYGDFNVQQIPFYKMAHDAILSGNTGWSWTTDLGSNFVGSFSFYLLGSPFFWLTMLFPSNVVPYLMAPLLMLKFSLISLAAYGYLRRFIRPDYALLGGLLYAFSGFSVYNIFFNHFHEAILYFPLMLLAMEMYMKDGRRGVFAIAVFLSALSNYYFFIGQAIFLIIYWFIRALSDDWKCSFRKYLGILFEAVAGTAMAGVLLLPSFYAVIQNTRTQNILSGWDLLIYDQPQRLLDIIHSFFFPQDIPARASFFPSSDNKWSSMSAWLPVFGCSGAIAYFQSRQHKNWIRRILIVCTICAVIPVLNAMFQLFNSMYYARWYYMFVMILVLATMKTFDEADEISVNWKRAFGWTGGITAAFALVVGLAPLSLKASANTGSITFGLYNQELPGLFYVAVAFAGISLLLAILLVVLHRQDRHLFYRWSIGVTLVVILIFGWYSIGVGKQQGNTKASYVINRAIEGENKVKVPDLDKSRVDFNNCMDNMGMFWQMPTIQAFQSIVPGSIMEFYPTVGVERSVGSRPDTSHYALRGLFSVKWLFDYSNDDNSVYKEDVSYFAQIDTTGKTTSYAMPGWSYYGQQNGFLIYKNDYYIPFGFTYEYYMTRTEYNNLSETNRELSLLKAIVLEDKDVGKYKKYLTSFNSSGQSDAADYSQSGYLQDCLDRKATAASSFKRDNSGFSATISLTKPNLVFFSVPYESGWSATVNGKPAEIVKTNVGFMSVLCPAGTNVSIRFNYKTPGLAAGLTITICAALALALYLLMMIRVDRRRRLAEEQLSPQIEENNDSNTEVSDGDDFDLYGYYPSVHPDSEDSQSADSDGISPEQHVNDDLSGSDNTPSSADSPADRSDPEGLRDAYNSSHPFNKWPDDK